MKVICSHDVDHLFITEHWKDRFIPGLFLRSLIDLKHQNIGWKAALRRFQHRTNRIKELVSFNEKYSIPSNFFFGMRNALSLSYASTRAAPIIRELVDHGAFVGLHGIGYNNFSKLKQEKDRLDSILGYESIGIRNHYLRQDEATKDLMKKCGFAFDSTDSGLGSSYELANGLIEFPISIMDVNVITQNRRLVDIQEETYSLLDLAIDNDQDYFVINFHDLYFDKVAYPIHFSWYVGLIEYLAAKDLSFVSFSDAVKAIRN